MTTSSVLEFLESFYIKYGSFIPLSESDVREHLKKESKCDLSNRSAQTQFDFTCLTVINVDNLHFWDSWSNIWTAVRKLKRVAEVLPSFLHILLPWRRLEQTFSRISKGFDIDCLLLLSFTKYWLASLLELYKLWICLYFHWCWHNVAMNLCVHFHIKKWGLAQDSTCWWQTIPVWIMLYCSNRI